MSLLKAVCFDFCKVMCLSMCKRFLIMSEMKRCIYVNFFLSLILIKSIIGNRQTKIVNYDFEISLFITL